MSRPLTLSWPAAAKHRVILLNSRATQSLEDLLEDLRGVLLLVAALEGATHFFSALLAGHFPGVRHRLEGDVVKLTLQKELNKTGYHANRKAKDYLKTFKLQR